MHSSRIIFSLRKIRVFGTGGEKNKRRDRVRENLKNETSSSEGEVMEFGNVRWVD